MQSEVTGYIYDKVKELLLHIGFSEGSVAQYDTLIISIAVIAIAFIAMEITYRIFHYATKRIVKRRHYNFLTQMLKGNRMRKVAHIIVPISINALLPITVSGDSIVQHYLEPAVSIYFVVTVVMASTALLSALGDSAFTNSRYHDRPVKGFIQIGKIIVYLIAVIIIISILTDKSPLYLIGGLGAAAVIALYGRLRIRTEILAQRAADLTCSNKSYIQLFFLLRYSFDIEYHPSEDILAQTY